MHTARLWKDPRTGIWKLRRRIPERYRSVADQKGDTVKITTGHADRKSAEAALPDLLHRWEEMKAEWERRLTGGVVCSARPLTNREAHALAGLWYQRKLREWDADPTGADAWEHWDEFDAHRHLR